MSVQATGTPKGASSKRILPFSKGTSRRLSRKGKEGANGLEQRPGDDAGVTTGGQGDSGAAAATPSTSETTAGQWQDPSAPQTITLRPASPPMREADSGHSHSVEQGTTTSDTQKEKASLSTTMTSTAASKHRKEKTSDTTHSAVTEEKRGGRSKSRKDKEVARSKKPKKKSIWSKLASAVFKCTWPTESTHAVDVDEGAKTGVSDPSSSSAALKELPPVSEKIKEEEASKEPEAPSPPTPAAETAPQPVTTNGEVTPVTSPPDLVPRESEDANVVVPPSPTGHVLPEDVTAGVTSGAVVPPGSTGQPTDESDESSMLGEDEERKMEEEDEEERLILNGGAGIPIGPDGIPRPLLPPIAPQHAGRKCLVLDLDETLVHSSFKSIQHADYVVPVEIEYHWHNVYVIKRPGVDTFLKRMGEIYEVVVFTASLSKYADPVLDKLDVHNVVTHRLFRESCYNHKGNYVKDLSQLGRPVEDTIILDNSPASYIFHPNNAVPVSSWFNDPHDTELTDLCPFLADLAVVEDVRGVLDGGL